MHAQRVFHSSGAAYEAHLSAQQWLDKLAAERRAVQRSSRNAARRPPNSDETCRRIAEIVSGEDVRQQDAHARNFARTVHMVSGGAPGLRR